MHCVSNYPLLLQNANLGYITYLQKKWNRDVGYSSHDDNWEVCLIAMSMGVKVIERHITLDRNDNGLDHSSSSTPDHFVKMSYFAKNMPKLLLGNTPKTINQGELLNRQNLGRSYYAKNNLFPGSLLQLENLDYKSPKTGIDKTNIDKYINKPIRINISKGDVITTSAFDGSNNISEAVIETARLMQLSLPIRFHDMKAIEEMFPISSFEFHLSFGEILSDIDISSINKNNQYSIHLPDYINPTQLIDPFSQDEKQKKDSVFLLDKTLMFARQLQDITKKKVVVVGSFSLVHTNRKDFFEQYKVLFNDYYNKYNIEILSQWLPPIAWYFGGSINLGVMNNSVDIEYIIENNINICMDVCHLIMGRNYYNFSATTLVDDLSANIKHLHIADALGIDGEGMEIGSGGEKNLQLISKALQYDCIKVIEVWQGHMNNYNGFKKALITLTNMYGK
jgi:N-acetylneuraminate synthase